MQHAACSMQHAKATMLQVDIVSAARRAAAAAMSGLAVAWSVIATTPGQSAISGSSSTSWKWVWGNQSPVMRGAARRHNGVGGMLQLEHTRTLPLHSPAAPKPQTNHTLLGTAVAHKRLCMVRSKQAHRSHACRPSSR